MIGRLLPAVLLSYCPVAAQDLARGTVIGAVQCRAKTGQSYALYLPASYSAQRAWPVLYCLDPRARGRIPVERFQEAAERAGLIVVGSNNSRNGPLEPTREAIQTMVADTHERFAIDDKRVYAAGFSGGSRVALGWGLSGGLAGVIACGAAFGPNGVPRQLPFLLYLAAGVDDFNYDEMREASLALKERGTAHRFVTFDGGHDWLPGSLAGEALAFVAGQVSPNFAVESKDARKQAEKYNFLCRQVSELAGADRRSLIDRLHRDASKPGDTPDRRVARRVLGGTFISAIEQARPLMQAKDYKRAAGLFEVALLARPDAAEVWFSLATAYAAGGDKPQALTAIRQAVANGFADRARLDREPLLDPIRSDRRYAAAVELMKQ